MPPAGNPADTDREGDRERRSRLSSAYGVTVSAVEVKHRGTVKVLWAGKPRPEPQDGRMTNSFAIARWGKRRLD
jgi:hypothetical protein